MKIPDGFRPLRTGPGGPGGIGGRRGDAERDAALKDAAKMYENHFLNEMVKAMRQTVPRDENALFKPNMAEKIFSEQLDQQYVEGWSDRGGVGLADVIYGQIKERYSATAKKDFGHPRPMLPITRDPSPGGFQVPPPVRTKPLPTDASNKLGFRFVPPSDGGAPTEVRAPLAGRVERLDRLDDDWNAIELDHGRGLRSRLTFPGAVPSVARGSDVAAGQTLARLGGTQPVLDWNLEWDS